MNSRHDSSQSADRAEACGFLWNGGIPDVLVGVKEDEEANSPQLPSSAAACNLTSHRITRQNVAQIDGDAPGDLAHKTTGDLGIHLTRLSKRSSTRVWRSRARRAGRRRSAVRSYAT